MALDSGIPPTPEPRDRGYWLVFGAIFSLLTFGLLLAAFYLPEISCDRWTLLRYVLPVFSGVAAGAFIGAINAKGSINQFTVAATGGFAVWLISLLVVGVPDRCKLVNISHFELFDSTRTIGSPGNKFPVTLETTKTTYDLGGDPSEFALFFGAAISNINVESEGRIDLDIEVLGLAQNDKPIWAERDHYGLLNDWRRLSIPNKFTPDLVQKKLGVDNITGKFLLVWTVECFTAKQLIDWDGRIRIKVTDHKQRAGETTEYLSIAKRPPQLNTTSSCAECAGRT